MRKNYATVDDVEKIVTKVVTDAVDVIVRALENYPTTDDLTKELKQTEVRLEEKIRQLQVDVNYIRHETPKRTELEDLKAKVESLTPLS